MAAFSETWVGDDGRVVRLAGFAVRDVGRGSLAFKYGGVAVKGVGKRLGDLLEFFLVDLGGRKKNDEQGQQQC